MTFLLFEKKKQNGRRIVYFLTDAVFTVFILHLNVIICILVLLKRRFFPKSYKRKESRPQQCDEVVNVLRYIPIYNNNNV